jgi:hypothetical protein
VIADHQHVADRSDRCGPPDRQDLSARYHLPNLFDCSDWRDHCDLSLDRQSSQQHSVLCHSLKSETKILTLLELMRCERKCDQLNTKVTLIYRRTFLLGRLILSQSNLSLSRIWTFAHDVDPGKTHAFLNTILSVRSVAVLGIILLLKQRNQQNSTCPIRVKSPFAVTNRVVSMNINTPKAHLHSSKLKSRCLEPTPRPFAVISSRHSVTLLS